MATEAKPRVYPTQKTVNRRYDWAVQNEHTSKVADAYLAACCMLGLICVDTDDCAADAEVNERWPKSWRMIEHLIDAEDAAFVCRDTLGVVVDAIMRHDRKMLAEKQIQQSLRKI